MLREIILVCIFVLNTSLAFAIGGNGATCNPSTANWPNCTLGKVPARAYVTRTVNIPAGHYATPYVANQANTEYILQGNMTADGTAITVEASYVVINLNGYTITYNQTSPGEGVNVGAWNRQYIAVVNGSIVQGAAMSEGDVYGRGNNPVGIYNTTLGGNRSANNLQTANLYLKYGGKDVAGIYTFYGNNALHEQNTVEDIYEFGTLKNRHQGIDAITCGGDSNAVIKNNTIINARQRGINVKRDSEVYGNHITIRSIATNSNGISGYASQNIVVYNNTIVARGEHPIGIGFGGGANNIEIYNNYIDSKTTALGDEYGGSAYCFDSGDSRYPCGNYAVGFRTTWGTTNLKFYNNEIHIGTDAYYLGTYSPTGAPVHVNAEGRGLMVAINAGETANFSNNLISVLDKDGTGNAFGIAVTGNNESDALFFKGNTVRSNIANIVLSDEYGYCRGYPLFVGNHLVKVDNYPRYRTISNQLGGYSDTTGRIVDNTYSGGASVNSLNFNASGGGIVSVYFGSVLGGEFRYSYRYHDNNGASSVLLREVYNPPISLEYAVPEEESPAAPAAPSTLRVKSP